MAKKVEKLKICTRCGKELSLNEFYKSQSKLYKADGKLPCCKQCVEDTYNENLQKYKSEEKALYQTLYNLDIYYDIKLCKRCLIDTYGTDKNIVRAYFSNINLIQYREKTAKDSPPMPSLWNIDEDEFETYKLEDVDIKEPILITKETIVQWGEGRSNEDYMFLQDKYDTMCNTYDNRNPSSIWTYEQIALNFLDIKKEREKSDPNWNKIKTLQESNSKLMGDCKMKIAQVDNSEDENICFGTFIKQIEDEEPILSNARFEDYDNIYKSWKEDFREPFAQAMKLDAKSLKRKNNKRGDK